MLYACNTTSEWRFRIDGVSIEELTLNTVFSETVTYHHGGHATAELCMELADDRIFDFLNWGVRVNIVRARQVVLEDGTLFDLYENFGCVRVNEIKDVPGKNHIRKIVLEMKRISE